VELKLEDEMALNRLRRVTDLFVEGTELYLGQDDQNEAVVIWVNKLNSFEVEESRRDGVSARGLRLLELEKEDSPERQALVNQLTRWDDESLARARVDQMSDELYLGVVNDLEADEDWAEKIGILRRMPQLLTDENAPADDPRRTQVDELNGEYLEEMRDRLAKAQEAKLREYGKQERPQLEEDFMEAWRNRLSLDEFMAEKRRTELYAAMRDCKASELPALAEGGNVRWDHTSCDHTQRLLASRADVADLPEGVLQKVMDVMDGVTVPQREAGNSAAPASSSESSGPSNAAEDSTPSTPTETPIVAPTT
jgi:hypothetical protein